MTAKQYLRQLGRIDKQLDNLIKERAELERAQTYLRSPQIEGDRVQTSPSGDPPWLGYLIKWEELTAKISDKWDDLIRKRYKIIDQINSLSDARYIKLLSLRYVEFKSLEEIAVEMGYTFGHVLRLHGQALVEFEEVMKCEQ